MQNKSSHTKKGAINIADTTIFLLQNPSTTDKIDTKYRVVLCFATLAQYGIYTKELYLRQLKIKTSTFIQQFYSK